MEESEVGLLLPQLLLCVVAPNSLCPIRQPSLAQFWWTDPLFSFALWNIIRLVPLPSITHTECHVFPTLNLNLKQGVVGSTCPQPLSYLVRSESQEPREEEGLSPGPTGWPPDFRDAQGFHTQNFFFNVIQYIFFYLPKTSWADVSITWNRSLNEGVIKNIALKWRHLDLWC